MNTSLIAVGTVSTHKLTVVANAIHQAGLADVLTIAGAATRSGVPEQPLGFDEIRAGAMARALGAFEQLDAQQPSYALGIENGLVDIGTHVAYIDLAVVVLLERNANKQHMLATAVYTTSAGLPCASKYVRRSFDTQRANTAGYFIAEDTGCDSGDWHSHITQDRVPRRLILEQAVLAALAIKFPRQP